MKDMHGRRLGALIALGICGLVTAVGFLLSPPLGALVGIAGAPAAVPLGRDLGPWVASASWPGAVGIGAFIMGMGTLILGDLIVSYVVGLLWLASPGASFVSVTGVLLIDAVVTIVVGYGLLLLLGALYAGPVAALLVLPCGIVWGLLVRALARTPASPALNPAEPVV